MQFALNEYKNELLCSESIDVCSRVPIPKINENENYIFISYSHKDYKCVFSDLADMYSSKVRFGYDKGLTAGKNWDDEVADIIDDSGCAGVVFYLSDNFFMSDSIYKEVRFVCEEKRKNYFCVNLTTDDVEALIDRNVIENERRAFFHKYFQQKKTYLVYKSADHYHELIEQIANRYNVVSNKLELGNGIYHGSLVNGRRSGYGECIYSDGSSYKGAWEDDKWHGYGEFLYPNGDIYRGNWENGKRNGDGEMALGSSGESYKGSYKDDLFDGYGSYRWENAKEFEKKEYNGYYREGKYHGKGTMIYADGSFYDGEWFNGKKHGHGTNTYPNGTTYVGEFLNNKRSGKGKYIYNNGDIYDGDWLKGDRNGNGTMSYANGNKYAGEWVQNNKEGHGEMQYANGDRYIGEWKRGMKHGVGEFYWKTPTAAGPQKYNGNFNKDSRCGYGSMIYANGDTYEGEFSDDNRNGRGTYKWYRNTIVKEYTGEWLDGDYHGKGTMLYANGEKYEGEWSHDKREGNGVLTYADGRSCEGKWENDSFYGITGLHTAAPSLFKFAENIYAWRIPFYLVQALAYVAIYYDIYEYKILEFLNLNDIDLQLDHLGLHVIYQCVCMIVISVILLVLHKTKYGKWYYCAIACCGLVFIFGSGFLCVGVLFNMNLNSIVLMGFLCPLNIFGCGHFETYLIRYILMKKLMKCPESDCAGI